VPGGVAAFLAPPRKTHRCSRGVQWIICGFLTIYILAPPCVAGALFAAQPRAHAIAKGRVYGESRRLLMPALQRRKVGVLASGRTTWRAVVIAISYQAG
jgi:hypothetical protein